MSGTYTVGTKNLGLTGSVTIESTDYQCDSITYKISVEKVDYTPLGSTGGWQTLITGGCKSISGTGEFAYDTALVHQTAPTDGIALMNPLTDTLATLVINLNATDSVSFSAHIHEIEGDKKSKGLHKVKFSYESSGTPTFAYGSGS